MLIINNMKNIMMGHTDVPLCTHVTLASVIGHHSGKVKIHCSHCTVKLGHYSYGQVKLGPYSYGQVKLYE